MLNINANLPYYSSATSLTQSIAHHLLFFLLSRPAFFLSLLSPSANHLLALISCTTFTPCLNAITGAQAIVKIHGTVLSILFARAISIAAAENGDGKRRDGVGWNGSMGEAPTGEVRFPGEPLAGKRAGVMSGELKHRR